MSKAEIGLASWGLLNLAVLFALALIGRRRRQISSRSMGSAFDCREARDEGSVGRGLPPDADRVVLAPSGLIGASPAESPRQIRPGGAG
jgi:hypothetical protein